ncbi:hypothetical protein [Nitrospirillum bahiense]|uniref:Uncharacterized protein n=1 Tax=Nitrospirillum amazonense TaxID=28077 RepID=A0A560F1X8_9PROT|nr:hypothetical protein [Nitrospirillum amazonense]TWB15614.1 hypothetical protein FBZ88_12967 [Nitrospirillum amazonense]
MTAPDALPAADKAPRTAFATACAWVAALFQPVTWGGAIFCATAVVALYVSALLVFSISVGVTHGSRP